MKDLQNKVMDILEDHLITAGFEADVEEMRKSISGGSWNYRLNAIFEEVEENDELDAGYNWWTAEDLAYQFAGWSEMD